MVKINTNVVHYEVIAKDKKGNSNVKVVFAGVYNENPFSITSFVNPTEDNLKLADELKQSEQVIVVELDEKNIIQAYNRKTGEYIYNMDGSPVYNGKLTAYDLRIIGFESFSQLESSLAQLQKIKSNKKK